MKTLSTTNEREYAQIQKETNPQITQIFTDYKNHKDQEHEHEHEERP